VARRSGLLILSLIVHGALGVGVASIEIKKSRASTAISYAETQKKKKPPEPSKVDPTPPEKTPPRALARRAAPARAEAEAPPPKAADTPAAFDGLPDFGVSLTGGVNGTGIALPVGGGGSQREQRTIEKVVRKAAPVAAALPSDGCDEPAAKPKPISVPQPGYTDDAQAAAVEGKVRVQLTVDETGKVVDVKLIAGLGHGLDEAALAAARRATFEPALHCGKPTSATFTISMRFKLPT
jgi:periplasmic protein TonB